ncbi:MAG: hypothetical protein AAB323_01010 [Pseudomonadota bacterium]
MKERAKKLAGHIQRATAFSRISNYYKTANDRIDKYRKIYTEKYRDLTSEIEKVLSPSNAHLQTSTLLGDTENTLKELKTLKQEIDDIERQTKNDIKDMLAGDHKNNAQEIQKKLTAFMNVFASITTNIKKLEQSKKGLNQIFEKQKHNKAVKTIKNIYTGTALSRAKTSLAERKKLNMIQSNSLPVTLTSKQPTTAPHTPRQEASTVKLPTIMTAKSVDTGTSTRKTKEEVLKDFETAINTGKSSRRKNIAAQFLKEHPNLFHQVNGRVEPK